MLANLIVQNSLSNSEIRIALVHQARLGSNPKGGCVRQLRVGPPPVPAVQPWVRQQNITTLASGLMVYIGNSIMRATGASLMEPCRASNPTLLIHSPKL